MKIEIYTGSVANTPSQRFKELLERIEKSSSAIIVAPELEISGFENLKALANETQHQVELIAQTVKENQYLISSFVVNERGCLYNRAMIIGKKGLLYKQDKHYLFEPGKEHLKFSQGDFEAIRVMEIDNVKIAILICFELRFVELWRNIEEADLVVVVARWGKKRSSHLDILTKALAITNQCYVAVCNSQEKEYGGQGSIIDPWGDDHGALHTLSKKEIAKIRRYIKMKR